MMMFYLKNIFLSENKLIGQPNEKKKSQKDSFMFFEHISIGSRLRMYVCQNSVCALSTMGLKSSEV